MKIKAMIIIILVCILVIISSVTGLHIYKKIKDTDDGIKATQTIPTDAPTATYTPTPTPEPVRRGTQTPIPEEVKATMDGKSMKPNPNISYEDLRYLSIPHYDFNDNVVTGHLVVHKDLAEEVLDIFAELFDAKYPIERMELIDKYDADDFTSIEYNNTSAFNYRVVSTGTGRLSKHAYGCAIDINPQMNPYVYKNGTGAHENAREYWQRDVTKWTREIDRRAFIGNDTEIYRIFKKFGWTWGGDWTSAYDYQHFEK